MADETPRLTHLDDEGAARMVDVGGKEVTARVAVAGCRVEMAQKPVQIK